MVQLWRPVVAGALILFAGTVLAGCGDDDEGSDGAIRPSPTVATTAGSTPGAGGEVSVLGIWSDEELASFEAMVAGWGGDMDFTGTRDITALLRTRVEGGNPPDVAIPAEIGLMQEFARAGRLTPLSECEGLEELVRGNYPESFVDLATVDGVLYGFFMKADTKGTIFYNPAFFAENNLEPLEASSTFEDLVALSDAIRELGTAPWSIGMEAGASSGFPGTDVVQQIVLNEQGEAYYDAIVAGEMPFTDDGMKEAWEKFGQLVLTQGYTVQGSGAAVSATNFQDATYPPFQDPPAAAMTPLGGFAVTFIKEQFPNALPGRDYAFFPWPGGKVTGGANIAYAFNSDPDTCAFLTHIAGAEAQQVWIERGGFTSVNEGVPLEAYPDDVARGLAEQLLTAEAFRFDLDDAIGGATQQAEFEGVLQYLSNPGSLDGTLANIDAAR